METEGNTERVVQLKRRHEKSLMAIDGVVAVGIGKTQQGSLGIIVSVKQDSAALREAIPSQIEDVVVEIQVTGEFKAL
jgi:hypothetical protein